MLEERAQTEDPWKPLQRLRGPSLALAIISVVRLLSEGCLRWNEGLLNSRTLILLILDAPVAALWVASASDLTRRRTTALITTMLAATIALADSMVSGAIVGRFAYEGYDRLSTTGLITFVGPRLLLYALQIAVCPFALKVVLRDWKPQGLSGLYADMARKDLGLTMIFCFIVTVALETFVKSWLFG